MKLVIDIDGSKAIPVRALPWITGWHFGAHEVAEALSGDGCETGKPFTTAYWLNEDGERREVPKEFWVGVTQRLEQAEDADPPYMDWHAIATGLLPEGVWVWANEWTTAYENSPDGPGSLGLIVETTGDLQDIESRLIQQEPFVPPELMALLLAGFNEVAPVAEPVAEPAPQAGPVGQAGPGEDLTQDPERRLARLRELGGNAKHKNGDWKFTGISTLVEREKSEGRKRSDEKTIRADLTEAAQDELDARRAGAFTGLGAR